MRYRPFLYVKKQGGKRHSLLKSVRRSCTQHPKVVQDNHNIFVPYLSIVCCKNHRKNAKDCWKIAKAIKTQRKERLIMSCHPRFNRQNPTPKNIDSHLTLTEYQSIMAKIKTRYHWEQAHFNQVPFKDIMAIVCAGWVAWAEKIMRIFQKGIAIWRNLRYDVKVCNFHLVKTQYKNLGWWIVKWWQNKTATTAFEQKIEEAVCF